MSKRVKFLKIQGCATTFGDWAPVVVIVWWACGMIRVPKFIILDHDGLCLWCVSGVGGFKDFCESESRSLNLDIGTVLGGCCGCKWGLEYFGQRTFSDRDRRF